MIFKNISIIAFLGEMDDYCKLAWILFAFHAYKLKWLNGFTLTNKIFTGHIPMILCPKGVMTILAAETLCHRQKIEYQSILTSYTMHNIIKTLLGYTIA